MNSEGSVAVVYAGSLPRRGVFLGCEEMPCPAAPLLPLHTRKGHGLCLEKEHCDKRQGSGCYLSVLGDP